MLVLNTYDVTGVSMFTAIFTIQDDKMMYQTWILAHNELVRKSLDLGIGRIHMFCWKLWSIDIELVILVSI